MLSKFDYDNTIQLIFSNKQIYDFNNFWCDKINNNIRYRNIYEHETYFQDFQWCSHSDHD